MKSLSQTFQDTKPWRSSFTFFLRDALKRWRVSDLNMKRVLDHQRKQRFLWRDSLPQAFIISLQSIENHLVFWKRINAFTISVDHIAVVFNPGIVVPTECSQPWLGGLTKKMSRVQNVRFFTTYLPKFLCWLKIWEKRFSEEPIKKKTKTK